MIKRGALRTVRIGRAVRVRSEDLRGFVRASSARPLAMLALHESAKLRREMAALRNPTGYAIHDGRTGAVLATGSDPEMIVAGSRQPRSEEIWRLDR